MFRELGIWKWYFFCGLAVEYNLIKKNVRGRKDAHQHLVDTPKPFYRRRKVVCALLFVLVTLTALVFFAFRYGRAYWASNTSFETESRFVCISPNSTLDSVVKQLVQEGIITDAGLFLRYAQLKGGSTKRYGGRYKVLRNMTTRTILNLLWGRRQAAVRLVVPSVRSREEMASRLSRQLWLDSTTLVAALSDSSLSLHYGFSVESFPAMFVPNTYEVYWDVPLRGLFDRFHREWKTFWNAARRRRLAHVGLSETEVATLASIVQEEVSVPEEMPRVAGVYMNRLRQNIPLKADPTVKFAVGDFTLRRIYFSHTRVDSPYNTYMYSGLPPGPIVFPEIRAIDAVLNYEHHDYLYFCARGDFSGRHNFSRTGEEHMQYARQYQKALRLRGITQ